MSNYSYVTNARFGYLKSSGDVALAAPSNKQLRLHSAACVNGSNLSMNIGIGYSLNPTEALVFIASGGAASAFSSGLVLDAIGNQLYFQANEVFDFIPMLISSLASAEIPTYVVEYWNGAWTSIAPQELPDFTKSGTALIINPALDWIIGSGGVVGLEPLKYTLRISASVVQVTPPQASVILPAVLMLYREEVEAKQALEVNFEENQFLMSQGQNIIPFFSIADAGNCIELGYRINP